MVCGSLMMTPRLRPISRSPGAKAQTLGEALIASTTSRALPADE
jgi:hypothetical protein